MFAIISSLTIICLLVILVGFDQFVGLIFNRYFSQVIAGFGYVLLGIVQNVGKKFLVWVIVISGFVLLLGLILLLSARFTKSEGKMDKGNQKAVDAGSKPDIIKKEITPKTMEEIEEQEKIAKKREKDG